MVSTQTMVICTGILFNEKYEIITFNKIFFKIFIIK